MVLAVTVRTRLGDDVKEFILLLERVRHRSLEYVHADRAYHSRTGVRYVHDMGACWEIKPERYLSGRVQGIVATGSRSWSTGVTRRGGETPMAARAGASWRRPLG